MESDKPGPNSGQVSPEYKSKCMDWAMQWQGRSINRLEPKDVVDAAKAFYDYVYGAK